MLGEMLGEFCECWENGFNLETNFLTYLNIVFAQESNESFKGFIKE